MNQQGKLEGHLSVPWTPNTKEEGGRGGCLAWEGCASREGVLAKGWGRWRQEMGP